MQLSETADSENHSSMATPQNGSAACLQWLLAASLFCAFALWMYWGVLGVLLLQIGSPHSPAELFSLIAIAGLSGGSLRIAMGFLLPEQRGISFFVLGISFLLFSALANGFFIKVDTPLWVLQLLALASGIGGGCSSSFIGAIHDLLPHRERSTALGIGLGLGHLGVAGAQILIPLAVTASLWGIGGTGVTANSSISTLLGHLPPDAMFWLPFAGYIWLLPLSTLILLMCLSYHNTHTGACIQACHSFAQPLGRMILAVSVGLPVGALGIWLISPAGVRGANLQLSHESILGLTVFMTLMSLRFLSGSLGLSLDQRYEIFNNKHTWLMSAFSAASLGSFLGFSAALPLTLYLVFGFSHASMDVHTVNVNAPGIFVYVWMAPFIGVLMHPVGGWMAERFGGARITQACILVMMVVSIGIAHYLFMAYRTVTPEQYFLPTLMLLLLLFAAAGAGHSSVMRTAAGIFPPGQSTYANIWLSAIAAFGVFYVPGILAKQLERNTPEQAMIGFALFYGVCLLLNGWFYLRRDSAFFNP